MHANDAPTNAAALHCDSAAAVDDAAAAADRSTTSRSCCCTAAPTLKDDDQSMSTETLHDEKCDAAPENSHKSSGEHCPTASTASPDTGDEISPIAECTGAIRTPDEEQTSEEATTAAATASADIAAAAAKSALAFTIDFDGDRQVNSKKYNDIFERFQRRHRRGASMSKLEDGPAVPAPVPVRGKPLLHRAAQSTESSTASPTVAKVQLRDKSRLSRRDGSGENRHSWSPRNSSVQPTSGGRSHPLLAENSGPQTSPARQQVSTDNEVILLIVFH